MSKQSFERLIRLEDEELESEGAYASHILDNESCNVPMIPNEVAPTDQTNNLENIFRHTKHFQSKESSNIKGCHFTINGRHIEMNPEQLKYISLVTLTIQNAALNLTMRAARTQKDQFSTSVAVTVAEILKLLTCVLLIAYEEVSLQRVVNSIRVKIVHNYMDTLKVAVPSFVYYVQNNLLYVGSTHLDAATSQVTYQLKILTTAIFSVVMLHKKLSMVQWFALFTLFGGVALIEMMTINEHKTEDSVSSHSNTTHTPLEMRKEKPLLGFIAILIACCLSGFAGVYFEKILKNSASVSLWIRNIQLSVVAIPIGLVQVFLLEYEHISTNGLFHGFTPLTWFCILLQVQGGLLVAVVVKFANNILKGFATSMAIVISTIASMFLFDFNLTPTFIFGSALVISSVMMYNKQ